MPAWGSTSPPSFAVASEALFCYINKMPLLTGLTHFLSVIVVVYWTCAEIVLLWLLGPGSAPLPCPIWILLTWRLLKLSMDVIQVHGSGGQVHWFDMGVRLWACVCVNRSWICNSQRHTTWLMWVICCLQSSVNAFLSLCLRFDMFCFYCLKLRNNIIFLKSDRHNGLLA